MARPLPYDALAVPGDLDVSEGDASHGVALDACRRATSDVAAYLGRSLVVRPALVRLRRSPATTTGYGWGAGVPFAPVWPVVLLADPATGAEVEDAAYASEGGEVATTRPYNATPYPLASGDQAEELGLPAFYGGRAALVYGGHRPRTLDLAGTNAALDEAFPRYSGLTGDRDGQLDEALWDRLPLLPDLVVEVAVAVARGHLDARQAGLGALKRRRQDRGERGATVELDPGWRERELDRLDRYRTVDVAV